MKTIISFEDKEASAASITVLSLLLYYAYTVVIAELIYLQFSFLSIANVSLVFLVIIAALSVVFLRIDIFPLKINLKNLGAAAFVVFFLAMLSNILHPQIDSYPRQSRDCQGSETPANIKNWRRVSNALLKGDYKTARDVAWNNKVAGLEKIAFVLIVGSLAILSKNFITPNYGIYHWGHDAVLEALNHVNENRFSTINDKLPAELKLTLSRIYVTGPVNLKSSALSSLSHSRPLHDLARELRQQLSIVGAAGRPLRCLSPKICLTIQLSYLAALTGTKACCSTL